MTMTPFNAILKNWLYKDVKPLWAHRYLEALSGDDLRAKKIAVVGFLARIQVEESSGIPLVKDASVGERRAVFEEIYKLFGGEESYKRKIGGESWTMAILEKKEELWRELGAARRKRAVFLWGGGVASIGLVVGLLSVWLFVGGHPDTHVAQGEKGVLQPEGGIAPVSEKSKIFSSHASGQESSRSLAAVDTPQTAQQKPVTADTSGVNGSKSTSVVEKVKVEPVVQEPVVQEPVVQGIGPVVAEKPVLTGSAVAAAVVPPEGVANTAEESKEKVNSKDEVETPDTRNKAEEFKTVVSVVENAGLPGGKEDRALVENVEKPASEMKELSSVGGEGESQKGSVGEKDTVGDGAVMTGADSSKGGESPVGAVSDQAGSIATVDGDSRGTGGGGGVDGEGAVKVTEAALRFVPLEPLRTEPLQGDLGK